MNHRTSPCVLPYAPSKDTGDTLVKSKLRFRCHDHLWILRVCVAGDDSNGTSASHRVASPISCSFSHHRCSCSSTGLVSIDLSIAFPFSSILSHPFIESRMNCANIPQAYGVYKRYRPVVPVRGNAKLFWKFALTCTIRDIRNKHQNELSLADMLKRYSTPCILTCAIDGG
jgi:hypothetical protein